MTILCCTKLSRTWHMGLRSICLAVCVWMCSFNAHSQIVYQCDFEDEVERNQWVLNEGPRADLCANNWYMGTAVNATQNGQFGMYISDTGEKPEYSGARSNVLVAARELTLPEGEYTLFFDWMAKGRAASGDGIWVCWVPDTTTQTYSAAVLRPAWVDSYRLDTVFNSTSIWEQGKVTFTTDGKPGRLAFVWTNTSTPKPVQPSGCVDNIMIIPKIDECEPPTDFKRTMKGTSMQVTWKGDADWYDARVYDYGSDTWMYFDSLTLKRITVDGLTEGVVQIFVRSHCGESGVSAYEHYTPFYFLPGKCVNYLAIDDATQCKTYIGSASSPRERVALVDSGYSAMKSRHTIHYMPGETDPRTDNMLATKPEGALASVRLGNWDIGAEGEAIEYVYDVPDGDAAILKLKYAIVLNQPTTSHPEEQQSSFKLDIYTSEKGKNQLRPLDGGCGQATFHVGYGDLTGWHPVGAGEIMWKEWTEVSVNLREYVGQRITVRLSTADCTQGGHYSYAYFTLDCESAELSGLNCGEENPTTSFTAPAGFNYEWYLPTNPDSILSREQTFQIEPMDTLTYNVDVISQTNGKCYYTLDACGIPRYPVAKAEYKWNGGEHCQNVVTFYNKSYIYYKNIERWNQDGRVDTIYTNYEKVQNTIWDFGDGEIVESNADSVVHVYPMGGGTYKPTITASISDGVCAATVVVDKIQLPDVSVAEREVHLSKGSMFNGRVYWEPYRFDEIIEEDGCEVLAHVFIHETEFTIDTTFCEGGYFQLGDQKITESGTYKSKLKSVQWPEVDSIVTLILNVEPSLVVEVADTVVICADQENIYIPITILQGQMDSLYLSFSKAIVAAGFEPQYAFGEDELVYVQIPDSLIPGYYPATLQLGTPRCPVPDKQVVIQINYSSSILAQKDGIIALLNDSLNGGFFFSEYSWYRNGELIEGADQSYLIVNDNDLGAQYTAVLTRESDGLKLPVCPILYNGAMGVETPMLSNVIVYPTIVAPGQKITINADTEWILMDMLGRIVIPASSDKQMMAPLQQGIYMFVFPNTHKTVRMIVK